MRCAVFPLLGVPQSAPGLKREGRAPKAPPPTKWFPAQQANNGFYRPFLFGP